MRAGGEPGEMLEAKVGGWGQVGSLGNDVSVDGEKDWRSRKIGRRGCVEAHPPPTPHWGACRMGANGVLCESLLFFCIQGNLWRRCVCLTPRCPTKIPYPGLGSIRKFIPCCMCEIFEKIMGIITLV